MECRRAIMIPIDKSENSKRVFDWYINTLRKDSDKIVMIHVHSVPLMSTPTARYGYSVSLKEWEGVESSVDKEVIQRVNEYEEICRKHNLEFKIIYEQGEPGLVICERAHREHVDLILMATRGLGKLKRVLLGSSDMSGRSNHGAIHSRIIYIQEIEMRILEIAESPEHEEGSRIQTQNLFLPTKSKMRMKNGPWSAASLKPSKRILELASTMKSSATDEEVQEIRKAFLSELS